jgi:hypothetical protein
MGLNDASHSFAGFTLILLPSLAKRHVSIRIVPNCRAKFNSDIPVLELAGCLLEEVRSDRSSGTRGQQSVLTVSVLKILSTAEIRDECDLCREVGKLTHGLTNSIHHR